MAYRILVADDDAKTWASYLEAELGHPAFKIDTAPTPKRCLRAVTSEHYDVVLLDIMYGSTSPNGFDLVSGIKSANPKTKVIMLSNRDDKDTMLHSLSLGAGYVSKTRNSTNEIARYIKDAIRQNSDGKDEADLSRVAEGMRLAREAGAVFESDKMKKVFSDVVLARENPLKHVLIRGEPGVGKELVAKAISREKVPFQTLNCAGLTDSLIQSQLFGHEKGAYTGADRKSAGIFGEAQNGDIFLDEMARLSLMAQAALLRTIEYGEVMRVGAVKSQRISFRAIGATNENLEAMVADGTFREDFYGRFRWLHINIPPLRDRPEDITPIVHHVVNHHPSKRSFSDDCIHLFQEYTWPGNIRELRDQVSFFLDSINRSIITISDLPQEFLARVRADRPAATAKPEDNISCLYFPTSLDVPHSAATEMFERFFIKNHIARLGEKANQSSLADAMKMPRSNLRRRLTALGIDVTEGGGGSL